ncbi:3-hydroxybutyrate dehydrogenase [Acrasis kona]|uniref:3-oxoacyl-[acyl-carrier-protein] reductase n=1 Tax=Acrasis kona TaxID=1008807 RepID=A0AAW2ZIE5_9EUKA
MLARLTSRSVSMNTIRRFSTTYVTKGKLDNQICVVTGAGSGIGRGIAKMFAKEGASVVVADINLESAKKTVSELDNKQKHLALNFDVTDENSVVEAFTKVENEYGKLNVLVSNAGVQHIDAIHNLSYENWRKIVSVHLDASFLCTRSAVQIMNKMDKKDNKSVIYIGSVHSKTASKLKAPYVSAKHGVLGLARVLAKEGGEHGIRSNVICPGYVLTPLVEKQIPEQSKNLNMTEEEVIKKVFLPDTVNGEFTSVDDVANTATFFASFESNSLTGQSIIVSNGWFME